MACILVEGELPFLPRDCQGRLPVALVKYDILTSWAGGLTMKAQNVHEDSRCKGIQRITSRAEIECVCLNARSIINKKNVLNIITHSLTKALATRA